MMSTRSLLCGAAVAALAWNSPAVAQGAQEGTYANDEEFEQVDVFLYHPKRGDIIVSGSRSDNDPYPEEYTGSATIIETNELRQRQVRDVADVLRDVPGVAVASVAGQTQLRLRGSEANHVLVLVDGIEVSTPFAGEFDVGTLQAEIGSRIEVLRGPQSALYGSDAIGGVVAYDSVQFDGASAWI